MQFVATFVGWLAAAGWKWWANPPRGIRAGHMEVVNARFGEKLVSKLDRLVEKGPFKSPSEALRRATEEYIEKNFQLFLEDAARRWLGIEMEDEELEVQGSSQAGPPQEGRGRWSSDESARLAGL